MATKSAKPTSAKLRLEHAPLPFIVLRELYGIADIEAVLSTAGAVARPENANLQDRINVLSEAYFGVTEEDCRPPRPEFAWVNGYNADYTLETERRLRVRNGQLEQVKAHWRGNPALGMKRTRYKLVA